MIDAIFGPGFREVCSTRECSRFFLNYAIERVTAWIVVIALLVLAYRLTDSLSLVAIVLIVQLLGRAIVSLLLPRDKMPGLVAVNLAAIIRIAALGSLILVDSRSDIWWALIAAGVVSMSSGVAEAAYARMIPALGPRNQVPTANRIVSRCEHLSAVAGPGLAGLILYAGDERAAIAIAAFLSFLSLTLVRGFATLAGGTATLERWDNPFAPAEWTLPSRLRVVISGLVMVAALGMVVRIALLDVVVSHLGHSPWVFAMLLAAVGIGALFGPLPVDRVLGHFPIELVLAGGVFALSGTALLVGFALPVALLFPALLASGLVIVTVDTASAVSLRMAVPDRLTARMTSIIIRTILAGQLAGLAVMTTVAAVWSTSAAIIGFGLMCTLLIGVHFLQSGGLESLARVTRSERSKSSSGT